MKNLQRDFLVVISAIFLSVLFTNMTMNYNAPSMPSENMLSNLDCSEGQVAKWHGTAWACADDSTISHDEESDTENHANEGRGYNTVSELFATVGGGYKNAASGSFSIVAGGEHNIADGDASYAAGRRGKANESGAYVWADSTNADFNSGGANTFNVRATGGISMVTSLDDKNNPNAGVYVSAGSGSWASMSDRDAKTNFDVVNGQMVLEKVATMPISTWNYKTQDESIRHMGPMAQDFHAMFGLGTNDTTITAVDSDGVALAAIQGLNEKIEILEAENAELKARLNLIELKWDMMHEKVINP